MQIFDENKKELFICEECREVQQYPAYFKDERGCGICGTRIKVINNKCKDCRRFKECIEESIINTWSDAFEKCFSPKET